MASSKASKQPRQPRQPTDPHVFRAAWDQEWARMFPHTAVGKTARERVRLAVSQTPPALVFTLVTNPNWTPAKIDREQGGVKPGSVELDDGEEGMALRVFAEIARLLARSRQNETLKEYIDREVEARGGFGRGGGVRALAVAMLRAVPGPEPAQPYKNEAEAKKAHERAIRSQMRAIQRWHNAGVLNPLTLLKRQQHIGFGAGANGELNRARVLAVRGSMVSEARQWITTQPVALGIDGFWEFSSDEHDAFPMSDPTDADEVAGARDVLLDRGHGWVPFVEAVGEGQAKILSETVTMRLVKCYLLKAVVYLSAQTAAGKGKGKGKGDQA